MMDYRVRVLPNYTGPETWEQYLKIESEEGYRPIAFLPDIAAGKPATRIIFEGGETEHGNGKNDAPTDGVARVRAARKKAPAGAGKRGH